MSLCMVAAIGCSSTGSDDESQGLPCSASSQCDDGLVCVSTAGIGVCTPTCEVSANACGGSASCSALGAVSVNVCQEETVDEESGEAEEAPKLTCESDADCAQVEPGTICATYKGQRECTIPCSVETDCDIMPEVVGIKWDLLTCLPDEGQTDRNACVPDETCFETIPSPCMDNSMNIGGTEICDPFDLECVNNMDEEGDEEGEEEEDPFDDFDDFDF